jgi:hypothetical protein
MPLAVPDSLLTVAKCNERDSGEGQIIRNVYKWFKIGR